MKEVYLVSLPAMKNTILRSTEAGNRVVIFYWSSWEVANTFVREWNIPGIIVAIELSELIEICTEQGLFYKEAEPHTFLDKGVELIYDYPEEDMEYFRSFLEDSYKKTSERKTAVERVSLPNESYSPSPSEVIKITLYIFLSCTVTWVAIYSILILLRYVHYGY